MHIKKMSFCITEVTPSPLQTPVS